MVVQRISTLSSVMHTMDLPVTQEQLDRFQNRRQTGEFMVDIFPNLSPAEREFILSGITPDEWNQAFGEKEIECEGKTTDEIIIELSKLPRTMYVKLITWNGNEYVRTVAQHLVEMQHLKNEQNLF